MKRRHLFFAVMVLLSLVFVFASCGKKRASNRIISRKGLLYKEGSNVPFTGTEKSKVADKTIEYDVVNGKKEGAFRICYADGKPQIVGQMYNNKNEGIFRYYYDSAQLESEGSFKNDVPDSTWTWYFIDGKIRQRGNFASGKREGKWVSYNETGVVTSEKYFRDGKEISGSKIKDKSS